MVKPIGGADLKPVPERPPFAGFLMRTLAFVIDCVLLYFVFSSLAKVARPGLLALNPFLPWLGYPVIYLYFFLLAGPLTKGQTLGKALVNIQVAARDGRPIGWGAAARRAVLPVAVFTVTILWSPVADYLLVFPGPWWYGVHLALVVIGLEGLALLLMLVFGILMHPWKRGWHDLWAGSFVVPAPPPPAFRYAMDTEPDPITARKIANHLRLTLIYGAILGVFFMARPLIDAARGQDRSSIAEMVALQRSGSTPNYLLLSIAQPSAEMRDFILSRIRFERAQAERAGQPVPTTETLRAQWMIDEHTIYAEYARRRGPYATSDLSDPTLRATINRLRAGLWKQWQKEHPSTTSTASTLSTSSTASTLSTASTSSTLSTASTSSTATLEARSFSALLFEPLALVLYNGRELKGRVRGPADPARGALIFEDVPRPQPQSADGPASGPAALPAHETPRP